MIGILAAGAMVYFEIRGLPEPKVPTGRRADDGNGVDLSRVFAQATVPETASTGRYLLIVQAPCGSCVTRSYRPGMEKAHRYAAVLFLQPGEPLSHPHEANGGQVTAYDPAGDLSRKLNALLPPRAYELDSRLHVVRAECPETGEALVDWGRP